MKKFMTSLLFLLKLLFNSHFCYTINSLFFKNYFYCTLLIFILIIVIFLYAKSFLLHIINFYLMVVMFSLREEFKNYSTSILNKT